MIIDPYRSFYTLFLIQMNDFNSFWTNVDPYESLKTILDH